MPPSLKETNPAPPYNTPTASASGAARHQPANMTRPARHAPRAFFFCAPPEKAALANRFFTFCILGKRIPPPHLRPRYPACRSRAVNRARTQGGTGASTNCRAPNAAAKGGSAPGRTRSGSGGLAPGVCPALRITPPATPYAGSVTLGQAAHLFCGFAWNKHALAAVRRECFTVCPDGQALHSRPLRSAPAGEGRGTGDERRRKP